MTDVSKTTSTRSFSLAILIVILLALGATPAMGQMGTKVHPGVRGGVDFMTLGGDDANDDLSRRTGFMVGGFVLMDFEGVFALQPELMYIQKGSQRENDVGGTTITTTTKLDYIEVPVLAKLAIPTDGLVSPTVFAGPTVGININAKRESEGGGQTSTSDISDSVSGTDFGVALGAGVDYTLNAGTISFDVRYELGLTSVDDTDVDNSIRNQGFMVTAGFGF